MLVDGTPSALVLSSAPVTAEMMPRRQSNTISTEVSSGYAKLTSLGTSPPLARLQCDTTHWDLAYPCSRKSRYHT